MLTFVRRFAPSKWARVSLFARSLVLLSCLALACADEDLATKRAPETPRIEAGSTFPLTLRDTSGTTVRLDRAPERIISLSPGVTEILFAIGAGDRVVGSDQFSDFPAAATRTAKLDYSSPGAEATLALRPDLVIMTTRQRQLVDSFRNLGMTVYFTEEPADLNGVYANIELLGRLTNHSSEAARVSADMRRDIDAVVASISNVGAGPRVYFELDPTLFTVGPQSFVGAMLTLLKARNIAPAGASPFPQITAEAVLAAGPEVILLSHPGPTAEVGQRPGWSGLAAVRDNRVISVDPDLVNRPGPRLAQGIQLLGRALYPDRVR